MTISKDIVISFRYDDLTSLTPIEVEQNLFETFARNGLTCNVGVVPEVTCGEYRDPSPCASIPLNDAKINFLKKDNVSNTFDIALHGFHHRTNTEKSPHSEFVGLDVHEQAKRISIGKKILEQKLNLTIQSFVPPWNTYDISTLIALEKSNIKCISANRYGPINDSRKLQYLPITIELQDLRKALKIARTLNDPNPVIVILMHPYDFKESGDERASFSAKELDNELKWLTSQQDIRVQSFTELIVDENVDLSSNRIRANAPAFWENITPQFLGKMRDYPIYMSANFARNIKHNRAIALMFLYGFIALFSVLAGHLPSQLVQEPSTNVLIGLRGLSLFAFGLTLIRSLVKKEIFFRSFLLLVIALSFLAGLTL